MGQGLLDALAAEGYENFADMGAEYAGDAQRSCLSEVAGVLRACATARGLRHAVDGWRATTASATIAAVITSVRHPTAHRRVSPPNRQSHSPTCRFVRAQEIVHHRGHYARLRWLVTLLGREYQWSD